jgi:hypothetical protein
VILGGLYVIRHKRNTAAREKRKVDNVGLYEDITTYRKRWKGHVRRMGEARWLKVA